MIQIIEIITIAKLKNLNCKTSRSLLGVPVPVILSLFFTVVSILKMATAADYEIVQTCCLIILTIRPLKKIAITDTINF